MGKYLISCFALLQSRTLSDAGGQMTLIIRLPRVAEDRLVWPLTPGVFQGGRGGGGSWRQMVDLG